MLLFYFQSTSDSLPAGTNGATTARASGKYTPLGALANLQPGTNGTSNPNTQHHTVPATGLVHPQPLQSGAQVHAGSPTSENGQSQEPSSNSQQPHASTNSNSSGRFSSTFHHQGRLTLYNKYYDTQYLLIPYNY